MIYPNIRNIEILWRCVKAAVVVRNEATKAVAQYTVRVQHLIAANRAINYF
ncbi:MAG: hypothetical protein M0Q95_15115 [Porticoccaceae bacterium]|nr:hypothetical protein [Porticoccaceae bacterium]